MKSKWLIHGAVFIALHLFGALPSLIEIFNHSEESILKSAPIRDVLNSSAFYALTQYASLLIVLSFIFIFSHYKLASKLALFNFKNVPLYIYHLGWAVIVNIALLLLNISIFKSTVFYLPDHFSLLELTYIKTTIVFLLASPLLLPVIFLLKRHKIIFSSACFLGIILITIPSSPTHQSNFPKKPNIIFIGVDSLRLELIDQFMPTLSKQLKQSTVFKNAYTPLARTYPAWVSILTGRHPTHHNARFNLQPESMLSAGNHYLPKQLKQIGYQTLYASDERRFSNIGKVHGFNQVIGPKTGAADFILGKYADFPLLNLLSLAPLSKWLLPELYANRAAAHLYHPQQFSQLLGKALTKLDNRPLFLATHFCLAHWPYTFVGHKATPAYTESPNYPGNLRAIDNQIAALMKQLRNQGLLNHSRIVFLSDHGESWGQVDTKLKSNTGNPLIVNESGHGMSILNPASQKVLIALKGFGLTPGVSDRLTSLMDISPTISDALKLPTEYTHYDGQSLLSESKNQIITISFESGLSVGAAKKPNLNPEEIAAQGMHYYKILKNGLLRLKEGEIENLISNKQLGLRQNNLGLARGIFTGTQPEYLVFNYQHKRYERHEGLTVVNRNYPNLVEAFCSLFSPSHKKIREECVTL